MFGNRYTIFITPPKAGKSRQLSLRKSTLFISIVLLMLFIIGDGIALYKYRENLLLKRENSELKRKTKHLEGLAQIVEEIEKEESFIRDFLGLEKFGSSMGGLGQGQGGVDPSFSDTSSILLPHTKNEVFKKIPSYGQSPVENALYLKKSLEGIVDELKDRKSEWDTTPTILPVDTDEYWISSGYGWRKSPFTGRREFHNGLDISSRRGTPIIAPADGKVIFVGRDRYLGKYVKIAHNDTLTTTYGHLMEYKVKKGQMVKRGDVIGLMGNTGRSTGHHLHYQVQNGNKTVNPNHYILNAPASQAVIVMR